MKKPSPAAVRARLPISIEYIASATLVPDPNNARRHTKKQIVKLGAGIERYGFTNPILVDEQLCVIAGHARLEAAIERKMQTVPCVRLIGLTSDEKTALALFDNKIGDLSTFDPERLAATLLQLETVNFDIEYTGFDTAEVDVLLGAAARPPSSDPADEFDHPSATAQAVSRSGDVWQLGEHRLLCGDALDSSSYELLLGEERASMVFTDMPYNVSIAKHASGLGKAQHREFAMASGEMSNSAFTAFMTTAMKNMAAFSSDGSIHFHCMDWGHMEEILTAGRAAYTELKAMCVWNKGSGGMGSLYRSQHELVFVFKSGSSPHINNVELGRHGRYRTNVWDYPGLNSFGRGRDEALESHPTVKPVALISDAIRDCSKRSDLVLDPFSGSGTTILAAERTQRRAAAIEIDPLYVDVAIKRWQTLTKQSANLKGDSRSFAAIGVERANSGTRANIE